MLNSISRLSEPPAYFLRAPHSGIASRNDTLCLIPHIHELLNIAPVFGSVLGQTALPIHLCPPPSCWEVPIEIAGGNDARQYIAGDVQSFHQVRTRARSKALIEVVFPN